MSADFNPLAYGDPIHAFWAEDPDLVGTAEGAEVTSWTNRGSRGVDADVAGGLTVGPTMDRQVPALGGRPGLYWSNASTKGLRVNDLTADAAPNTIVAVVVPESRDSYHWVWGSGSNDHRQDILTNNATNAWRLHAGAGVNSSLALTIGAAHVLTAAYTGGSAADFRVNGVTDTGLSVGPDGMTSVAKFIGNSWNQNANDNWHGWIAFLAVFNSDITSEDWFAEFELGLLYHYGVLPDLGAAGSYRKWIPSERPVFPILSQHTFTDHTSGSLATVDPEIGPAWEGPGVLSDYVFASDGSGLRLADSAAPSVAVDVGEEDVWVTVEIDVFYNGGTTSKWPGLVLRGSSDNILDVLAIRGHASTTDPTLILIDVGESTAIIHTWDLPALMRDSPTDGDSLKLVFSCVGDDITLYAAQVNGNAWELIEDTHTLGDTAAVNATDHGAGSGSTHYGLYSLDGDNSEAGTERYGLFRVERYVAP